MADAAKQQAINALTTQLAKIAAYDPAKLAEGSDLGAINFKGAEDQFAQSIGLAAEFRALPLDLLPLATVQGLQGPVQSLAAALEQVEKFTLVGQPNPEAVRNQLLNNAQSYHDQAFTALTPHLAYLSLKSAQVQETMRRSRELLQETEQKVQGALTDIEAGKTEIDGIVRAARDAVAKIGVGQFATKFEQVAKEHGDASQKWLIAAAIMGLFTIGAAIGFLFILPPPGDLRDPAAIQRIVTKLVVLSIMYFGAIWTSRNYRAHRHLAVVNAHRQNALTTFETFVKAASDDQTKNSVLLEATHCIFSPAVTGYLGMDEENPSSRIVEILKTVGGTAGSTKTH